MSKKKVLITPLNWGLGHAARCIPVIRSLVKRGHEVHIGSDGVALALLKEAFTELLFTELPGYGIHYKGKNLMKSLFFQIPFMMKAIKKEKAHVKKYVKEHQIDIIISDNRFGCRSKKTENVFITHQLQLILSNEALTISASAINKFMIEKFDEIWVPDAPPPNNISGMMSDRKGFKKISYLGPLSRFKFKEQKPKRDFIVILSGPEPARTYLELAITEQVLLLPYSFLIVRGLPGNGYPALKLPGHTETVNFMTAENLNQAINESRRVISRTGYTTVMDLVTLNKKGILIPTPGQPEQEYLGRELVKKGRFIIASQEELDLETLCRISLEDESQPAYVFESRLEVALDNAGL